MGLQVVADALPVVPFSVWIGAVLLEGVVRYPYGGWRVLLQMCLSVDTSRVAELIRLRGR